MGSSHPKAFGGDLDALWGVEEDVPVVLRECVKYLKRKSGNDGAW